MQIEFLAYIDIYIYITCNMWIDLVVNYCNETQVWTRDTRYNTDT